MQKKCAWEESAPHFVEPRLRQIFSPLFAVAQTGEARRSLEDTLRKLEANLDAERGASLAANVIEIIFEEASRGSGPIGIREITEAFARGFAADYGEHITARWMGHVVRKSFALQTTKSNGRYVIPRSETTKLAWLFEKYGFARRGEDGIDVS